MSERNYITAHEAEPLAPLDPRFDGYLSVFNNLEKVLWGLLAFLGATTALSFSFLNSVLSQPEWKSLLAAPAFFVVSLFYFCGARSIQVIKKYRDKIGNDLKAMEQVFLAASGSPTPARRTSAKPPTSVGRSWYFTWRTERRQRGAAEASVILVLLFYVLGVACLLLSLLFLVEEPKSVREALSTVVEVSTDE